MILSHWLCSYLTWLRLWSINIGYTKLGSFVSKSVQVSSSQPICIPSFQKKIFKPDCFYAKTILYVLNWYSTIEVMLASTLVTMVSEMYCRISQKQFPNLKIGFHFLFVIFRPNIQWPPPAYLKAELIFKFYNNNLSFSLWL